MHPTNHATFCAGILPWIMIKFVHMKDNNLYTQIKVVLAKEPEILAAYVVGSTVSGKTTSESDFDLVIIVRNRKIVGQDKVYELVRNLHFPRDLDLSVADRSSSPVFLYQVIAKGKRIYEKEQSEMSKFEAFALHNYYDTAHIRNTYHRYLKEKLSSHANR